MQARALVVGGHVGQPVGGLEGELLEDLASGDPQVLVGLQAEPPARVGAGSSSTAGAVFASRSGPSIGCRKKWSKSRCSNALGSSAGLGVDELQLVAARAARGRRRPSGSRRPSRCPAGAGACRWSRPRSRSRARAARRPASSSSWSSGSPPVQTTNGGCVGRSPAHVGGDARRPARRRSANVPPPGPSVPTKSVSQNWQTADGPVLLAAGPQVAAGEPAEHGRPAGVGALALQGVEDLLDQVAHGTLARGLR